MEILNNPTTKEEANRPVFLTILCILTFISSGLGIFTIAIPFNENALLEVVNTNPFFTDEIKPIYVTVIKAGWAYHIINALLAATSLLGAFLMWNLRKLGFHLYALSNLLMLFSQMYFLQLNPGMIGIVHTFSLIGLYAIHLRLMK